MGVRKRSVREGGWNGEGCFRAGVLERGVRTDLAEKV